MDRERLTALLNQPGQVDEKDLDSLRSMAQRFPWFSGARLLLAVGEQHSGNVLAHDGPGEPAAHLPSRHVLYDLVHATPPAPQTNLRVVHDEPQALAVEQPGPVAPTLETGPPAPPAARPLEAEPGQPAPTDLTIGARNREASQTPIGPVPLAGPQPVPQTEDHADTTPSATQTDATTDHERNFLDRLFIEAASTTGYDLDQWAEPTSAQGPEVPLPMEEEFTPHLAQAPNSPVPPLPEPAFPEAAEPPPAPVGTPAGPVRLRFTDWLEHAPSEAPVPVQPTAATAAPHAPTPDARPPAGLLGEVRTTAPAASPQEIMDRFIQQSAPPAPAQKAAFFNPQKAAKRSLQDDGLVSETLARIHEQQGNFTKAKEVYDRLAIKHPEKSVYFAALSKALEGRSNK
ncbi:MAG: hypothetical protein KBH07_02340 [Flavobacteriales bacterium]|nr:hypothetical protein [Flavobacteriales bacterium]MBP9079152.1 hypothetical protein [Flavobacteriales bacterium]